MSWRATARIKELRENLTRSEKLILYTLADYHNDKTGRCDPSVQHIAEDSLTSPRQTIRLLHSLAQKGFIEITERPNTSNQYTLLCLTDTMSALTYDTARTDISDALGLTKSTPTPDIAMSVKPSLEPSIITINNKDMTNSLFAQTVIAFQNRIGLLGPIQYEKLGTLCDELEGIATPDTALSWVNLALEACENANARKWSYFAKVLDSAIRTKQPPGAKPYRNVNPNSLRAGREREAAFRRQYEQHKEREV